MRHTARPASDPWPDPGVDPPVPVVRFGILGPLEILIGDGRLRLGNSREQKVLAALLLEANRTVALTRLVDMVWDDTPPDTAAKAVRNCVSNLRRRLTAAGAPEDLIGTEPSGYTLRVRDHRLDVRMFEHRVSQGRQFASAGRLEPAVEQLREALALWRAPALADVRGDVIEAAATRLDEQRCSVQEECLSYELALGRDHELVAELSALVAAHPARERARGQLMLALYRSGRRTEALEAYRQARETLVETLGIEPGPELAALHQSILNDDAHLAGPAGASRLVPGGASRLAASGASHLVPGGAGHLAASGWPDAPSDTGRSPDLPDGRDRAQRLGQLPAQLPADTGLFAGRERQLRQLDALLDRYTGLPIATITGTAGVGKTALAVHWAHRVRDRFPEGQLYVDLRGYAPGPAARPIEVLARFIHAMGMPAERIPTDIEAAASMYRSLLADRRLLIVLDNAAGPDQVRPLLPGSPANMVIVTSRDRLAGLIAIEGADPVALDVLTAGEAETLLAGILGEERTRAEPDAVDELAELCAFLPLALRIAAANLTGHPYRGVADYVRELRAGDRLRALRIEGDEHAAVRLAFDLSYAALAPDAQRMFQHLGRSAGMDLSVEAAAALSGTEPALATQVLDRLAAAHLVQAVSTGRFTCHDLLRRYAADLAAAPGGEPAGNRPAGREPAGGEPAGPAAVRRLDAFYLSTVHAAARVLYPQMLRLPEPEPEPGVRSMAFTDHATALAWLDAERANLVATVAQAAGDGPRPAAWLLADALRGYFHLRRYAVDWLTVAETARGAARAAEQPRAEAGAWLSLADAYQRQSRYAQAIEQYTHTVALCRQVGWRHGQAAALCNLGFAYWQSGQLRPAAGHLAEALAIDREIGWVAGAAVSLGDLGAVHRELGQLDEAAEHHELALAGHRRSGSRMGEAIALGDLGETYHAQGRYELALTELTRSLELHRQVGNRGGEADVQRILAAVYRDTGRLDEALSGAGAALVLARETGDRRTEVDALNTLATVELRLGRYQAAAEHHQQALDIARDISGRYQETEALIGLASAYLSQRHLPQAHGYATEAIAIAAQAEYRLLAEQAGAVLGSVPADQSGTSADRDATLRAAKPG